MVSMIISGLVIIAFIVWAYWKPKKDFSEYDAGDEPLDLSTVPDYVSEQAKADALRHVQEHEEAALELDRLERLHKPLVEALPPKVVHAAKHIVKKSGKKRGKKRR